MVGLVLLKACMQTL